MNVDFILKRLSQESTWRGIIATVCGVLALSEPSPEMQASIVAAGVAVVGLVNMLKGD